MARNPDDRMVYPAAARNGPAIQAVLTRVLPNSGRVLEIGSGSGQHAIRFARAFPNLTWLPSDPEARCVRSIDAWRAGADIPNLEAARTIDVHQTDWAVDPVDTIYSANMIHVAPWSACIALFAGAKRYLTERGTVILYGPFRRDGQHTSDTNAAFDRSLRGRDAAWGVRDLEAVADTAGPELILEDLVQMPANNLMVLFRRV